MRLVERADKRPHHCAAIPHLGSQHHRRYIFCGYMTAIDPAIYVSVQAVEEMCKLLDWPTPHQHAALQRQTAELASRVVELEDQLTEATRELDAVYILKSKNWTPARKQGRPRKTTETQEAA